MLVLIFLILHTFKPPPPLPSVARGFYGNKFFFMLGIYLLSSHTFKQRESGPELLNPQMPLVARGRWQDQRSWDLLFSLPLEETWKDFMKKAETIKLQ